MKNIVQKLPKSNQEEKRKTAIKLLRKKIEKKKIIAVTRISTRSYYRYKAQIKQRKTGSRKVGSGRQKKLTKSIGLQI